MADDPLAVYGEVVLEGRRSSWWKHPVQRWRARHEPVQTVQYETDPLDWTHIAGEIAVDPNSLIWEMLDDRFHNG